MQRVGFLMKVRKNKLEEYKKHHQSVWPEMIGALQRNGWGNYSLFATEDGHVFGYFEAAESFGHSLDGMSKEDANLKWQKFMAPYFENLTGRPDQSLVQLDQVFYLE